MYRNIYPLNLLPDSYSGLDILNINLKNLVMASSLSTDKKVQASISEEEMVRISKKISRNFSPIALIDNKTKTLKNKISSQELLKVSQNINLYYAPKAVSNKKSLTLLSIDPRHIYVYWNLNKTNSATLLQSMYCNELVLRVYSEPEQNLAHVKAKPLIEVPVHNFQHREQLSIPKADKETMYSAYIGKCTANNDFTSIVKSNDLHISKAGSSFISPLSAEDISNNNEIDSIDSVSSPASHFAGTIRSGQKKP